MTFREFLALLEDAPVAGAQATTAMPSTGGTEAPGTPQTAGLVNTAVTNTINAQGQQFSPQVNAVLLQAGWDTARMQKAIKNAGPAVATIIKNQLVNTIKTL